MTISSLNRFLSLLPLTCAAALSVGCLEESDPVETRFFWGDVYDGATGARVTDYKIQIEYFGRRFDGKVNSTGSFELAGVPADHDYSVTVQAPGYRGFRSVNGQFEPEDGHGNSSFHFDAYLFSSTAQVGDVTFRFKLDDSLAIPSGSLRLRPTSASRLMDDASETPGAVAGQVWQNDNDLLARTVFQEFPDGQAVVSGNDLTLGVPYQVAVFNVPGYQVSDTAVFRAGMDGDRTVVLSRLGHEPLSVTYNSVDAGNPVPDGVVTLVFNQPVELDPRTSELFYREQFDDAFSISSVDLDQDGTTNTLRPDLQPFLQEHGTSFTIDGETMQLRWDPNVGLETADPQDVIRSVTYGGLDGIFLRPVGGQLRDVVTLASLLGGPSVLVIVQP